LVWAERLVSELAPKDNTYGSHPTYVVWSEDGRGVARNRSVCSSFVSRDLMRAYGLTREDLAKRFGTRNPLAKDYYGTLAAERGFTPVSLVGQMRPGDIIAIAYPPGSHPTGHVMIADSTPVPHIATKPIEPQTRQFAVTVIDSSASYHGFDDTRYVRGAAHGSGVGRGILRLYADPGGRVTGYSWSLRAVSRYYDALEHRLAVGRYNSLPFRGAPPVLDGAPSDADAGSGSTTEDPR
jgi:hypothetical protein